MRTILIIVSVCVLGGCSLGKELHRDAEPTALTPEQIEALRREPVVFQKDAVVKEYEAYLKRYGGVDPSLTSRALKRLGDLYLETANQRFNNEMEAYEIHPEGPPPLVDYTKAIETYEMLLRSSPEYSANDQTLYALSRAYAESGQSDRAAALLERIQKEYPDSRHRQEASFRLGEYYFDHGRYGEAAEAYRRSLSLQDPFFIDKAQYKLGWTFFNMKDYPKAIDNFLQLVNSKVTSEENIPTESGSLVWEAMTYVATSFRILGGPVPLSDYFQERGSRPYEPELYLMIGNQYISQEDPESAVKTFGTFIRQHPLHPMAPIFSSYIIETYEKQKESGPADDERIRLVRNYASGGKWYRANDDAARARARPIVKATMYRLALSTHARAKELKTDEGYRTAAGWYEQFLREYPEEPESPEAHILLAETLFELKDFSRAGGEYATAAFGYPSKGPDSKAAFNAIVAYEKAGTKRGERQVVALASQYATAFPKDPKTPALLLKAGEIQFEQKQYDDAIATLQKSLRYNPRQEGADTARKLIANSLMQEGRYEDARQAYRRALASLPTSDVKNRREMTDLLAAAVYKQGESRRSEDRTEEAAKLFEAVAAEAPGSGLAPQALSEAATLREGMNQTPEAIADYRSLIGLKPESDLAAKAFVRLGGLYEKDGDWTRSADAYASASRVIPDQNAVPQLLMTAGLYYEKGGRWDEAYDALDAFTKRYPENPDAAEALYEMGRARQKENRDRDALPIYEKVIEKYPETRFAAESRFEKGEAAFRNLKAIQLKEPLDKSLTKKTRAMEKAVTLYMEVIETRYSNVVTASAYRLGEIFEDFKSSLLSAAAPRNLTEEEREEYRFQLEEKAFPFEEKAVEAYASNVRRIQNQSTPYNDWVKKSYERLAELRPALFRRPERAERIVTGMDQDMRTTRNPEEPENQIVRAER
jgi:tetratricopeptide (TPR) repeat protein